MTEAKVYYSDMRAHGRSLLSKLRRLMKEAGFESIDFDGKFVAVGNNGKVACSSDGIVWEHSSAPELSGFQPMDICFGNSRFVAVGNNGKLFYSVNGTGWIQQETGIEENLYGVCVIP